MKRTLSIFSISLLLSSTLISLIACEADPATVTAPVPSVPPTFTASATNAPTRTSSATQVVTQAAQPSPTKRAPTIAPTPTVRQRGGSITIAGVGAPSRQVTALPGFVADALYDSLLRVNPQDGSLTPGLAEGWLVSDDAKTVAFILRKGVKWHDGRALTADDVVFTLKALSDPRTRIPPAADFGPLADVTAPDARTVSVTFREPYCAALTYIGKLKILPKHILEDKSLTDVALTDFIGTGPLVLKTWQDDALTFRANAAYWNGEPWITDWTYRVYSDEIAARTAVARGEADVTVTSYPIESPAAPRAANEFFALAMNTRRAPTNDARVRQAILLGIDRAAVVPDALAPDAVLLETSMLPTFWAYPQDVRQAKFDPKRAQQLLAEAGWRDNDGDGILEKDGKPLELTLWARVDDPRSEMTAQILRAQLAQIGIRAILKMPERYLFLTRVFLQEYDLALAHFNIPLDPDQQYFWSTDADEPGYGLNVTGYSNAQVDKQLETGDAVARCDPAARQQTLAPVFQQLANDAPMVFLFSPPQYLAANARVRGAAPSSFAGDYWNLNVWEVTP